MTRTEEQARAANTFANAITGSVGGVKLGKEFFVSNGPEGVRRVTAGEKASRVDGGGKH